MDTDNTDESVYLTGAAHSVAFRTAAVVCPAFLRTFFPKIRPLHYKNSIFRRK